ncbi:uncharacterized protein LOC143612962 [Bidens hawaiensis]|uniref:uncharacterized protein LOC143612962 n=1 Tax=Bidens hawaiensis TaxID=980011 RepID=UPI00404A37D3
MAVTMKMHQRTSTVLLVCLGANEDAIFLHLFPFSLTGRASTWLDSQPAGAFSTWEALRTAFFKKYFPPTKASRLRDQIHSFHMEPDEPYYQAWERFQGLMARCSQHGLTPWALVEKFYNGLTYETQARFDTAAGGNLMDKKSVVECNEVNLDTIVAAALESLASEIKNLKAKIDKCELCRGGHGTSNCPLMSQEHVEFIGGQNRVPNAFNVSNQVQILTRPDLCKKLDEMMQQIITIDQVTQKTLAEHDLLLKNQQSSVLDMQRTIGDIARRLDERPPCQFSGSTQQNPAAKINAISTRSGRALGPEKEIEVEESDEFVDEEIVLETPRRVQPRLDPASTAPTSESIVRGSEEKKPRDVRPSPLIDHSRIPYPARVKNQKFRREYGNFLDMFMQPRINLPFIEVLQHMPKYAKFLKDILKRKESLEELSTVPLKEECSAVVLNKVPEKLPDPGVFTIPCLFGRDTSCQALADLGASINLMPYSLFEKLGLGELTPTHMALSLVDRSVKYPRGIIENLLVKVDNLVFP